MTFTLPGFASLKREGIVLTGTFTANVDADMRVGGLEETVTVTGESPIVDVSSARRETTINNDILKAIPTVRSYNALVVVVPGVVTNLNDTVVGTSTTQFPIHGGRNNEGRMTIDGLNIGNPPGGNQPPSYVADVGNAEEVTFQTSGGLGESETGGLTMNVVPKTGGNRISGSVFFSGTNESLQAENFVDTSPGLARRRPTTRSTTSTAPSADPSSRIGSGTSSTPARRAASAQRQPVVQPERRRCHQVAVRART